LYAKAYSRKEKTMVNVAGDDSHAITMGDVKETERPS